MNQLEIIRVLREWISRDNTELRIEVENARYWASQDENREDWDDNQKALILENRKRIAALEGEVERSKLPRVQPDKLEEGRFYYVTCKEMPSVCPTVGHFKDGDLWLCGWDVDEDPRSVDAIFGPIPEFELEGE